MGKKAVVLNWGARTAQDQQDKAVCKENMHSYLLGQGSVYLCMPTGEKVEQAE